MSAMPQAAPDATPEDMVKQVGKSLKWDSQIRTCAFMYNQLFTRYWGEG